MCSILCLDEEQQKQKQKEHPPESEEYGYRYPSTFDQRIGRHVLAIKTLFYLYTCKISGSVSASCLNRCMNDWISRTVTGTDTITASAATTAIATATATGSGADTTTVGGSGGSGGSGGGDEKNPNPSDAFGVGRVGTDKSKLSIDVYLQPAMCDFFTSRIRQLLVGVMESVSVSQKHAISSVYEVRPHHDTKNSPGDEIVHICGELEVPDAEVGRVLLPLGFIEFTREDFSQFTFPKWESALV